MDSKKTVALFMLNISAVFHTFDHNILLGRMFNVFGIKNSALDWFKSYLSKRSSTVLVDDVESEHKFPVCGIPQGSVLAPLLFTMYLKPLGKIIEQEGFFYHCYADDVQCYMSVDCNSDQFSSTGSCSEMHLIMLCAIFVKCCVEFRTRS